MTLEKSVRLKGTPRLQTDEEQTGVGQEQVALPKSNKSGHVTDYNSDHGYFSVSSRGWCSNSTEMCPVNSGISPAFEWSMAGVSACFGSSAQVTQHLMTSPIDLSSSVQNEDGADESKSDDFERHGCCVENPPGETFITFEPATEPVPEKPPTDSKTNTECSQQIESPLPVVLDDTSSQIVECKLFDQNKDGDTLVHLAVIFALQKAIFLLLRWTNKGDLHSLLRVQNAMFQTPLILAVLTAQSRVVRMLTVLGSSLSMRDRHGNSALHIACQNGDLRTLKALTQPISQRDEISVSLLLKQKCAERLVDFDINAMNYDGYTCLHLAAMCGHVDVVDYLLTDLGCNVNIGDGCSGRTILHHAVESQNYEMLRFLVTKRRKLHLEIDAQTYAGHTPLKLAFGRGLSSITSLLILLGADGGAAESDDDVSSE